MPACLCVLNSRRIPNEAWLLPELTLDQLSSTRQASRATITASRNPKASNGMGREHGAALSCGAAHGWTVFEQAPKVDSEAGLTAKWIE
jgi:hypothetical protein